MDMSPSADVLQLYRRQYFTDRNGEVYKDLAGSETSCMHGSFLRGNREALYLALFTPLRGVNARVDYVERLVPGASRREPVVRPAEPPA